MKDIKMKIEFFMEGLNELKKRLLDDLIPIKLIDRNKYLVEECAERNEILGRFQNFISGNDGVLDASIIPKFLEKGVFIKILDEETISIEFTIDDTQDIFVLLYE